MTETDIEILKREIDAVTKKYNNEKFLIQGFDNYSKPIKIAYTRKDKNL